MKRFACWVALFVAGCGSSPDEGIVRDLQAANDAAAATIAKAEDMETVADAIMVRNKKYKEVQSRIGRLTREQRELVQDRLRKGAPGEETVEEELAKLPERLKGGPAPKVVMQTSMGDITIELHERLAPVTVKNFLTYVDDKFFDGKIFHRVIADFMIQGGGFEPGGLARNDEKKTRPPIVNESYNGLTNERGTIAMARTDDPNSATAQFFINVKNNAALNRASARDGFGYAVFGKVTDGMEVVDKIRAVKTHQVGPHGDVPVEDVIIKSVRRVEKL